jgi:hypothetical protein
MSISVPVYARARSWTGFAELVSGRGGDVGALLEAVGLDADVLSRPDAMIPFRSGAALLDRAAETLELPDIGLRLGRLLGPGDEVEVEVESIGTIRTPIVARADL